MIEDGNVDLCMAVAVACFLPSLPTLLLVLTTHNTSDWTYICSSLVDTQQDRGGVWANRETCGSRALSGTGDKSHRESALTTIVFEHRHLAGSGWVRRRWDTSEQVGMASERRALSGAPSVAGPDPLAGGDPRGD
jgi:hypothetical protein